MRTWGYTLTRKDPTRPWIVLEQTHHTADLPDEMWFGEFEDGRWPTPEWTVELDPGLHTAWVNDRIRAERLH
jgi:hypothetical protein